MGSHGTPKAVIDRLNAAVVELLADPAVGGQLVGLGQDIPPRIAQTPEALGAYHRAEMDTMVADHEVREHQTSMSRVMALHRQRNFDRRETARKLTCRIRANTFYAELLRRSIHDNEVNHGNDRRLYRSSRTIRHIRR